MEQFTELLSAFFVSKPNLTYQQSIRSVDTKSVDTRSSNTKSVDTKSVDTLSVDTLSVDTRSVDTKSVDTKSVDTRSVDTRSNKGNRGELEQVALRPSEFHKRTIFVVAAEAKESIRLVSELILKLSLMKDIETVYDKQIEVVSNLGNKHHYKKMLFMNPYMHFTGFKVNTRTSTLKRGVRIVDIGDDIGEEDPNSFTIFVSNLTDPKRLVELYNSIRTDKMLVFKHSHIKTMQKQFYNKVLKGVCKHCPDTFDEYYKIITDENLDIHNLILVDDSRMGYN